MWEMLAAGRTVYSELKNLCIWNKTHPGMGSFYRSKHELIFVWKSGTAAHTNNFHLGQHGRHRTNVWDYANVHALRAGGPQELAWYIARYILGVLGFEFRNPYKLRRQKAFIVPEVIPPGLRDRMAAIVPWDSWDPDIDKWEFEPEEFVLTS